MIYLPESVLGDDEEDDVYAKHPGETSLVEAAFLLDGRVHVFSQVAPWVPFEDGGTDEDRESTEGGPATRPGELTPRRLPDLVGEDPLLSKAKVDAEQFLRGRRDELVAEFRKDLSKRSDPLDPSLSYVDHAFRTFVALRVSTPTYQFYVLPHDGSSLDTLVSEISRGLSEDLNAEERARVDPLVTECVAWARGEGIRSLAKSDVEAFLDDKRVRLSGFGRRLLWTKAKVRVKTGK